MALGASRGTVLRLILQRGLALVGAGMAIGMAAALFAGKFLARMLYGVSATDPFSMAGAGLLLLAIAFIGCYLPAFRASRVDPLSALRLE
jgi:ABC-type antimicrobial peptide transport system permease subunit